MSITDVATLFRTSELKEMSSKGIENNVPPEN
ncbi:hypothetical protein MNBD_ALPHA03-651, partial [hydrothermal vent metagenome]